MQWCNRWGGGRGAECPQRLLTGKCLLTYREKIGKEKNGEEKKDNCKREGGKLKMEGRKVIKWGEDLFLFFFKFIYLFLNFFFTFHFSKPVKFVLGLPKWKIFYREKAFCPLRKISLLCPWNHELSFEWTLIEAIMSEKYWLFAM